MTKSCSHQGRVLVGTKAPERNPRGKRIDAEMPWTVCDVLRVAPSSAKIQLMHHEQKTTRTPPTTAPSRLAQRNPRR